MSALGALLVPELHRGGAQPGTELAQAGPQRMRLGGTVGMQHDGASVRTVDGEMFENSDHRCRTDTGRDQDQRGGSRGVDDDIAERESDLQCVAGPHGLVQP